jgi:hypothetical protein
MEPDADADAEDEDLASAAAGVPEPPEEHAASSIAPVARTATDAPARSAVVGVLVMAGSPRGVGGRCCRRRAAAHD